MRLSKCQFVKQISHTTFAYLYLVSATFGYSLTEKKQPLSTGQRLFLFSEINPFRDLWNLRCK